MIPILFSIGGLHFYTFGVFIVSGIITGTLVVEIMARRERLKIQNVYDTVLLTSIVGLITARLIYFLLYADQFKSIWQLFYFWQGGLVAYAGIGGGTIFAIWYFTIYHENPWRWLDLMAIGFFGGWVLGKIGCFLSGNSFNQAVLGFPYEESSAFINLWEAGGALLAFVALYYIYRRKIFTDGIVFLLGIITFSLGQFMASFWRGEETVLSVLTLAQIISLVALVMALIVLNHLKYNIYPTTLQRIIWRISRRS